MLEVTGSRRLLIAMSSGSDVKVALDLVALDTAEKPASVLWSAPQPGCGGPLAPGPSLSEVFVHVVSIGILQRRLFDPRRPSICIGVPSFARLLIDCILAMSPLLEVGGVFAQLL